MKNIKTIYEYFSDYSKEDIDYVLNELNEEDRKLITLRYGNDLENPQTSEEWNAIVSKKFYGTLVNKINKLLAKRVIDNQRKKDAENKKQEELTSLLFSLLNDQCSNSELCEKLNIDNQQLYKLLLDLKNKGRFYSTKYYSDGSIKYRNMTNLSAFNYDIDPAKEIIMPKSNNKLKLLLISDLHFGSQLERIDLINQAFNYCAKNGINIILCGGDFIDGDLGNKDKKITDLYEQTEYFIKNYPYDKNILTFGVGGNHDLCVLQKLSFDFIDMCKKSRSDIIIGGYCNSTINIKNDQIHLFHQILGNGGMSNPKNIKGSIVLHGHHHKYTAFMKNNALHISIPSLCEINNIIPAALELQLYFEKGIIVNAMVKHLYFGVQDIVLSEFKFNWPKERTLNITDNLDEIFPVLDEEENSNSNKVLVKSINNDYN